MSCQAELQEVVDEDEMEDSGAATPTSHVSADVPSAELTQVKQVRFFYFFFFGIISYY